MFQKSVSFIEQNKDVFEFSVKLQGKQLSFMINYRGAQWLSGRVLDSRRRDSGFEPHQRHCIVVFEQDTFILA